MQSIAFIVFSLSALVAGYVTVRSTNIVRSVIGLFLCMVFIAGLYFLLAAPFIGAMQLMIYAGGITVLMIFAIMLVRRITGEPVEHLTRQPLPALVVAAGFAVWMVFLVWTMFEPDGTSAALVAAQPHSAPIEDVANSLILDYLMPFELASILLLVAMVGAIALTVRAKQPPGPRGDGRTSFPSDDE